MPRRDVLMPQAIRNVLTLAGLTYLETLKDGYVLMAAGLAAVVTALSVTMSEISMFAHERIIVDFALSAMTLTGLTVGIGVSQVVMAKDMRGRGACVLLTRPIGREVWLIGRFVGVFALMLTTLIAMAAIFVPSMWLLGVPLHSSIIFSLLLVPVECTVAQGISMAMRCLCQTIIAAATTVVLVGGGYLLDPNVLSEQRHEMMAQNALNIISAVLPQMRRLNGRAWAAHAEPLPHHFLFYGMVYGAAYTTCALCIGVFALRRRRAL